MHGPTSHFYFSQRLRLHYVDWGNEGAPPLLLIHGGRDHCRNWDWVAARLRERFHIIAPDLRGHGDSQWAAGSSYEMVHYIYDIAQLVHQKEKAPVTIVAHSLGGAIALLYSGLYPETVKKVAAIEGLGPTPQQIEQYKAKPIEERMHRWIDEQRAGAGRSPRKYATLDDAVARMKEENKHLNDEQARHLTLHGALQNEDGTYSWKFDNFVRFGSPAGLSPQHHHRLWGRIASPVLLIRGAESWASDPVTDGRIAHFQNARLANIEGAGHWSHHDQFDRFMEVVEEFLRE